MSPFSKKNPYGDEALQEHRAEVFADPRTALEQQNKI
jgi:hypothetical protein